MNDRTLVKLRCNKEMLDIRTVSWTRKSPYSFSILRSELQQLEQRPQNRLISGDCGSFAVLRLTQRPGDMKMLEIRFTWLQEIGAGKVHGWQENIRLPYEPFHVFVENGKDMDGAEWRHLDAKITAARDRIKSLEAKKQEILAPKPPRKPRKTKKQKIQEIVKLAMKNGMSVEEIAGQLHVEVED